MGVDARTKQMNAEAIEKTVAEWTDGRGRTEWFMPTAKRESAFNHRAIGDTKDSLGPAAFRKKQRSLKKWGNPWADRPELWGGSYGLFQLMAPYQVEKWSKRAHPYVLFHPVVATVVASRLFNKAVKLGARNLVDVRMVWGFGPKGLKIPKTDERYLKRVSSTKKRLRSMGYPEELAMAPTANWGLEAFGTGEQPDQLEKFVAISEAMGMPTELPPEVSIPAMWDPADKKDPVPSGPAKSRAMELGVTLLLSVPLFVALRNAFRLGKKKR